MHVFINVKKGDVSFLKEYLGIERVKTKYEALRFRGDAVVILFNSGKLLLQGRGAEKYREMLLDKGLKEQKKISYEKQEGLFIGSDETLKGDTFGGLVVAGVKANDFQRESLRILGVMDSKKLLDSKVPDLAREIKRICKTFFVSMMPDEYNKYEVTPLMNKLHKAMKTNLGAGTHVVDYYPGCNVGDIRVTKAESKYVEVAAASIVARDEGLKQFQMLSKKLGVEVPKGSTHVKSGLEYLKRSGKDHSKFVKIKFKNVKKVFN